MQKPFIANKQIYYYLPYRFGRELCFYIEKHTLFFAQKLPLIDSTYKRVYKFSLRLSSKVLEWFCLEAEDTYLV